MVCNTTGRRSFVYWSRMLLWVGPEVFKAVVDDCSGARWRSSGLPRFKWASGFKEGNDCVACWSRWYVSVIICKLRGSALLGYAWLQSLCSSSILCEHSEVCLAITVSRIGFSEILIRNRAYQRWCTESHVNESWAAKLSISASSALLLLLLILNSANGNGRVDAVFFAHWIPSFC